MILLKSFLVFHLRTVLASASALLLKAVRNSAEYETNSN